MEQLQDESPDGVDDFKESDFNELHYAALKGNVLKLKHLITNGANIHAQTASGLTSLFIAVHQGHWKVVLFLMLHEGGSLFEHNQQVSHEL